MGDSAKERKPVRGMRAEKVVVAGGRGKKRRRRGGGEKFEDLVYTNDPRLKRAKVKKRR